jgi:hypothetical protein
MHRMKTWRRADPGGGTTAIAFACVIIGVAFTVWITAKLVNGTGRWVVNPIEGILCIYGFLVIWTGLAWRMYRTGVYVSDQGVRIVYLLRRQRIIAWRAVAAVDSRRAMIGDLATVRDAIVLKLIDGTEVETPIQRANWLAAGARKNMGPVYESEEFDAILSRLRGMRDSVTTASP